MAWRQIVACSGIATQGVCEFASLVTSTCVRCCCQTQCLFDSNCVATRAQVSRAIQHLVFVLSAQTSPPLCSIDVAVHYHIFAQCSCLCLTRLCSLLNSAAFDRRFHCYSGYVTKTMQYNAKGCRPGKNNGHCVALGIGYVAVRCTSLGRMLYRRLGQQTCVRLWSMRFRPRSTEQNWHRAARRVSLVDRLDAH